MNNTFNYIGLNLQVKDKQNYDEIIANVQYLNTAVDYDAFIGTETVSQASYSFNMSNAALMVNGIT